MAARLEPAKRVKCTYQDCPAWFETEKAMKSHKKRTDEHDYCHKCDKDFDSYDDMSRHKILRPDKHNMACRMCGEEFKSKSGLRRHIELNHKVDQDLPCIGCGENFHRASLLVEHLEFGHCTVISPQQFMGHIVHKHLVAELLKGGPAYDRFMQKISKYDAAQDYEEEGGVDLESGLDDEEGALEVDFRAIEPEVSQEDPPYTGPYPPLRSQARNINGTSDIASTLGRMSIAGNSDTGTVVGSSKSLGSNRTLKPWGGRSGKELFPNAKPTPVPSEFSISYYDEQMEQQNGINIMNTRFWDPLDKDWNPERFYDTAVEQYYCPFTCEQTFDTVQIMRDHILYEHRSRRMKCPSCLKTLPSVTALMAHCEAVGSRCRVSKAENFNIYLDKLTGGFLSVTEKMRPDHLHNPTFMVENPETGRPEPYTPPTATYMQYEATKPPDWKEPQKVAAQIGGGPSHKGETFEYQKGLARW